MPADLTKINDPFGELDDATKGALLLAHHQGEVIEFFGTHGWIIKASPAWAISLKYRVRPAPAVVGSVTMSGFIGTDYDINSGSFGSKDSASLTFLTFTFPTRNGVHVPGTYTAPDGLRIVIEVAK